MQLSEFCVLKTKSYYTWTEDRTGGEAVPSFSGSGDDMLFDILPLPPPRAFVVFVASVGFRLQYYNKGSTV